jgi:hypothetical protein
MARLGLPYVAAALFGGAIAIACAGCPNGNPLGLGPTICDRSIGSNPARNYCGGTTYDGVYETTPWSGFDKNKVPITWLPWRGGQHYTLLHGLGCVPTDINAYLAFSEKGLSVETDAGPADVTSNASGDSFGIIEVDNERIVIGNDSCVDFFIRVTASGCERGMMTDAGSDVCAPEMDEAGAN